MKRPALSMSVRREYSLRARVLFALLALIQVIAPTWHVCAMGGVSCCPPQGEGESTLHCAPRPAPQNQKPKCSACPQPQATQFLSAPPEPHGENCLAKLLLGMPWQSVAPAMEVEYSVAQRVAAAREYSFQSAFFSLLPPGRAPPVFS